ncbi:uncharacterized protein JCM6883_002286 [Sporobolomyces salmoneus]|uniref:uncharacterized protein n=1 Tax=Sporobolomyces salmoneus TaxID=183962 RepID=UPI0031783A52
MPSSPPSKRPILNISDDPYRHQPSASSSSSFSHRAPTSPRIRQFSTSNTASTSSSLPPERRSQSPSSVYFPPASKRMNQGLPFGGDSSNGRKSGWIATRLRGSRLRWTVLVGCIVLVVLWSRRGDDRVEGAETEKLLEKTSGAIPSRPKHAQDIELPPPIPEPVPVPPPPSRPKGDKNDNSPIDIAVRPSSTIPTSLSSSANEKFLAYSPHSGYHNQRISLENALTLAYLLDRTLLVPPIWLGHAIPYISFDKLQRRLEMASKSGLEERCIPFGEGDAEEPIPRECEGFWDWTLVDWDFLVDFSETERSVPVKRRWNMSKEWMEEELGLKGARDTFSLRDETMYQYRFYDSIDDDEPLDKWTKRINVEEFKQETEAYKLVHVGTMFGTNRIRATTEEAFNARSKFRRGMMFRNEAVDEVTEAIRDQLGGEGKYYGLHLRVGDGVFQEKAKENMRGVWETLCVDKMKLDKGVCDEMRVQNEQAQMIKREEENVATYALSKRANSRPQREGAYHHAPLPPLPTIRTLADSPLSSSLTCRRPLHTASHLLPFNAPLFIATDSKVPRQDPNLSLFFDSFPCTFTLSDFSSLDSLDRMNRLRNADDKTPLAQFLYPQLDAQIAAWGRGLVGTPQSTYSRFAIDVLHQMYHKWDIIERG